MAPTRLTLIRHGETDWNRQGVWQGHQDVPLNATGWAQAQALVAAVSAEWGVASQERRFCLVASDLTRCLQTAQPLAAALGVPVQQDPALRERHFGQFEGRTLEDMAQANPALTARWIARDPDCDAGGGETGRVFMARVHEALQRWAAHAAGAELIVVTHGGVVDVADRLARGLDWAVPRAWKVANAGLYRLIWRAGRFEIVHAEAP